MDGAGAHGQGYRLGPRVPVEAPPLDLESPTRVPRNDVPSRVYARASPSSSTTNCDPNSNSNLCEKPVSSQTLTLPIVLGIA